MATWGGGLGTAFPAEWNARQEVHRGTRRSASSASARDLARDFEVVDEEVLHLSGATGVAPPADIGSAGPSADIGSASGAGVAGGVENAGSAEAVPSGSNRSSGYDDSAQVSQWEGRWTGGGEPVGW